MRRAGAGVEREADGSWLIARDHLDRAARFEERLHRDRPVEIEVLSRLPLDELAHADAATWLDRELASPSMAFRDAGFGREAKDARTARGQWLAAQQLAEVDGDAVRLRAGAIALLQRRELLRVAGQLSDELGASFDEAMPGERVEGILRRRIDLVSGRFALIEKSREFTLVPWRSTLDQHIGKQVGGIMREGGINWRIGRDRGGPSIS